MDYTAFVNSLNKIACVVSVKKNNDGSFDIPCIEAVNKPYLDSANVEVKDFVPGRPYFDYINKDSNFEAMTYRCINENRLIHAYVDAEYYNAWMDIYMMPMNSDEEYGYCLFSYDMTPKADTDRLADVSPQTAVQVIKTTLKLRETDDFSKAINSVIDDIRKVCKADRCCLLLTDFANHTCKVLGDSVIEGDDTPRMDTYINEEFVRIVESWSAMIAGSNCFIIHDANEMEKVKDLNYPWYMSMKMAGAYNLVLYPLRSNSETIGYIWATNFDVADTLNIKSILGVTTFILAAEISNHLMFRRMQKLSVTDLLTGLYNRNAMNNKVSDIVNGKTETPDEYGIVFIDLNGLKAMNDKYGHDAGDELLKSSAAILKEVYPDCDIFRVGGDEFLVFASTLSKDEFYARVEMLKKKCDESENVRFAIGTCFEDKQTDVRDAMHIADESMYKDKDEYYVQHPELRYRSSRLD
ncbi:MAG: sensor domain-containing diguanylate cyclase [Lachnospiraceae bacterium]|nr:sensor domain-containing diguanylate cyclase [Lachnospiraceae bacterium]